VTASGPRLITSDRRRLAWRSLKQDLAAARFRLWVNNLGGHAALPRVLRYLVYRRAGLDIRTANIYPGCIFVARNVRIGADTFVNRGCLFEGAGPLTIGPECQIAMEAAFLTSTHPWQPDGTFARLPQDLATTVGRRCWIGARAMVLPGVTIGDGCVIAAGSVVTRDCEAGHLYAGVPARKIRRLALDPAAVPDSAALPPKAAAPPAKAAEPPVPTQPVPTQPVPTQPVPAQTATAPRRPLSPEPSR
jgi:maltose O-acetyltransferase